MDERIGEITKLIQSIKETSSRLNELLVPEAVSYELIRGDVESCKAKKQKLLEENRIIEAQNEESRKLADKIVETANEEAKKIISASREVLMTAQRKLRTVEEFCAGIDKKRFNQHLESLKA